MADEWTRDPDVITTDLDTELVLLNRATRAVFSLNATGRVVWAQLEQPCTLDTAVRAVRAAFDVDEDTARTDVGRLLGELVTEGLARPH